MGTIGTAIAGAGIFPHIARAQKAPRLRFAVMGIHHEHIFRMVQAVRDGGGELAMIYNPDPDPNHGAKFLRDNSGVKIAREEREVFENPKIQLVVSNALPAKRAQLCLRAMRAGKDVLADKGGFLNLEDLAEARRVQAETNSLIMSARKARACSRRRQGISKTRSIPHLKIGAVCGSRVRAARARRRSHFTRRNRPAFCCPARHRGPHGNFQAHGPHRALRPRRRAPRVHDEGEHALPIWHAAREPRAPPRRDRQPAGAHFPPQRRGGGAALARAHHRSTATTPP